MATGNNPSSNTSCPPQVGVPCKISLRAVLRPVTPMQGTIRDLFVWLSYYPPNAPPLRVQPRRICTWSLVPTVKLDTTDVLHTR